MFYVLIFGLTLIAGLWMTRPLWKTGLGQSQQRQAANVAAYQRRRSEVQADLEAGLLDAETAASLSKELDARLLREADQPDMQASTSDRSLSATISLSLLLIVAAGFGYVSIGSWKLQDKIANAMPGVPAEHDPGSLDVMAKRLEARLEADPQDVDGWVLLARSQVMLDDFENAARAYRRANQLTGQSNADWLVDEGEALALSRDRDMLGRPQRLFAAALKISPDHQKGLWYSGLAAIQADEHESAITFWTRLSEQELPPVVRESLDQQLAELRGTSVSAGADAAQQAARPVGAEAQTTVQRDALAIKVDVSVDPAVSAAIDPSAVLFVFAKAASGPPMPLAVYRGRASELPVSVTLDDSMAMMPALKLSQFDSWIISARVSKSGQPQVGSGDVQGSLSISRDDLGNSALALALDEVVP